jgi:hypothetical protein
MTAEFQAHAGAEIDPGAPGLTGENNRGAGDKYTGPDRFNLSADHMVIGHDRRGPLPGRSRP